MDEMKDRFASGRFSNHIPAFAATHRVSKSHRCPSAIVTRVVAVSCHTIPAGGLEQVPEELVVNVVVILHFGRLHKRSQLARTTIGGRLLQVRIAPFDVIT